MRQTAQRERERETYKRHDICTTLALPGISPSRHRRSSFLVTCRNSLIIYYSFLFLLYANFTHSSRERERKRQKFERDRDIPWILCSLWHGFVDGYFRPAWAGRAGTPSDHSWAPQQGDWSGLQDSLEYLNNIVTETRTFFFWNSRQKNQFKSQWIYNNNKTKLLPFYYLFIIAHQPLPIY